MLINHVKNLSRLLEKYQLQVLDLIRCLWTSSNKENEHLILIKIFLSIFKDLKNNKLSSPIHLSVYSNTIKTILKSRSLPLKTTPTLKELGTNINIEEFEAIELKDVDLFSAFKTISPQERIILCLILRHKLTLEETATLFSTTSGSILSKYTKSKNKIARYIIESSNHEAASAPLVETKECFFVKNLEPAYNNDLLSKEDRSRILKHLKDCHFCKNFYNWHHTIIRALEKVEKPILEKRINSLLFKKINNQFLYNLKNSWLIRVPVFTSAVAVLVLSVNYLGAIGESVDNRTMPKIAKAPLSEIKIKSVKEVDFDTLTKTRKIKEEEKIVYKFVTQSRDWEEIDYKLKKLLSKLTAVKAGTMPFGAENNKGSYYHFMLPKENFNTLVDQMKKIVKFNTKEEKDTHGTAPEKTRAVIWVGRLN